MHIWLCYFKWILFLSLKWWFLIICENFNFNKSFKMELYTSWISACGESVTLPQLPAYTKCRLPSYCTGAQCCSNIAYLGKSLEVFVLVDPCSYRVSIGLERRNINVTLMEFTQGSWQMVTLGNVLRLQ